MYENDFKELIEWIYPDYCLNIFDMCHRFDILLKNAIERLHNVTRTDYNQIALGVKTDSHQTGLMVFADDIVLYKQRYRLVAMDGLMAKSYVTGNNILIDDINTDCYRKEIIYLTKKPYFINGTILENIKIGNENVTMEEIQEVCKKIGIHNYIMELKEGYNSSIGEEGKKCPVDNVKKSQFVRGYLRRASVVLLDEATSDVDGQSERICVI